MKTSALLFDFFGVICGNVADRWLERNVAKDRIEELHQRGFRQADVGALSQKELLSLFEKETGMPAKLIESEWDALAVPNLELISWIRALPSDLSVGLLTNAPAPIIHELLDRYSLEDLFDAVVISSEIRVAKPDPRAYEVALDALGTAPGDTVFIDDSIKNVEAARSIGMRAFLYNAELDLKSILA